MGPHVPGEKGTVTAMADTEFWQQANLKAARMLGHENVNVGAWIQLDEA